MQDKIEPTASGAADRYTKKPAALAASAPVAPAPQPEPFALYDGEKWYANEEAAICSCADMAKLQKVYTEQQVRVLLATGGQAQADARDALDSRAIVEKLPRYTYGYKSDEWGMGSHLQSYQDPEGKFLNREEVIAAIAAAKEK